MALFFDDLALVGGAEGDEQQRIIDEMVAVLEGSDPATGAIFQALGGLAAGLTIDMRDVAVTDSENATFVFDLLINGNPTQVTDATGRALNEDGVWKLSQETWGAARSPRRHRRRRRRVRRGGRSRGGRCQRGAVL